MAGAIIVAALIGCRGAPWYIGGIRAATPKTPEGAINVSALISRRCKWCHSPERVEKLHQNREGWEKTIGRMVGKGARLRDDERKAMIDFLAARDEALLRPPTP